MNPFAQALSAALELCVASKEITENGSSAGFFYREAPVFAACPEIRPLPAEREGAWEWDGEAYVPAEGWQPQN